MSLGFAPRLCCNWELNRDCEQVWGPRVNRELSEYKEYEGIRIDELISG